MDGAHLSSQHCDFGARLVYRMNSRLARATECDTVSNQKKKKRFIFIANLKKQAAGEQVTFQALAPKERTRNVCSGTRLSGGALDWHAQGSGFHLNCHK